MNSKINYTTEFKSCHAELVSASDPVLNNCVFQDETLKQVQGGNAKKLYDIQ